MMSISVVDERWTSGGMSSSAALVLELQCDILRNVEDLKNSRCSSGA